MRFRWFAVVSALVLFSGISTHKAIAQAVVDGRPNAALPQRPGSLTAQESARMRALRAEQTRASMGLTSSAEAASSGATTPGFGGFVAGKFVGGYLSGALTLVGGDFNHDGKPDVAAVDFFGNIEVLLNDSNGSFKPPVVTSGGQVSGLLNYSVNTMVSADLNGDGYADLILGIVGTSQISGQAPGMLVYFSQKNGTFGTPTLIELSNPNPNFHTNEFTFSTAVTTSSGYSDIVTVEPYRSNPNNGNDEVLLQTFVNNGTGTFTSKPVQTVSIPANQQPFQIAQAIFNDLNHDSKTDMLLEIDGPTYPSPGETVEVLMGNGDGTFQTPNTAAVVNFPETPITRGLPLSGFQAQSLTGDASEADLILNNEAGVYVAMSNGDGTFKTPMQIPNVGAVVQVLIADLNGDGKPDLITSSGAALLTYLGNGDGTFGAVTGTAYAYGDGVYSSLNQTFIADYNGDGKLDFANVDTVGDVQLGIGNGDGTFVATPMLYSANSPVISPQDFSVESAVDLNGDGVPDLIAFGPYSILSAVTNATGGFTYHTALAYSAYEATYIQPVEADFNGDGKQDVVLSGSDGTIGVALSNGDGTLNTKVAVIKMPLTLACEVGNAAAGDINGDGKIDLVLPYGGDQACGNSTAVPAGYFTVLGNGDGTFTAPAFHAMGVGIDIVALARFDGTDQPLDLIVADDGYPGSTPNVSLLKGDGKGGFGTPLTVSSGDRALQILTDDFNQDGKPDLTMIVSGLANPTETLLLYAGKNDGTFAPAVNVDGDVITNAAMYTDLNGDGVPDLVGDGISGLLSVNLGTGKGTFAPPIHYFYASDGGPLLSGSFLGDNTQSIVGFTGFAGGTAFFMNQGGSSLTVTPSAVSVAPGQSVTLTAGLTATLTGQPAPTGTVTFFDGTTQIGSEAVGTPLVLASPALGVHSITAKYSGDRHFNPNTSTAVSVTVATPPAPDFTFTAAGGSLTVAKGGSGTLSLTVAANASLSAAVTFACSGLPSEASCGFSPASLNVAAGSSGTSTLTITTKAASANVRLRADGRSGLAGLGAAAMAGLMCFLLPRRRGAWLVLVVVLGLGVVAGLSGCGGGSKVITPTGPSDPGTPAGTSNVTVTATAVSGSTTVSHTMTVALTVQ